MCVCYSLLISSVCYTVVLRYSSMIMQQSQPVYLRSSFKRETIDHQGLSEGRIHPGLVSFVRVLLTSTSASGLMRYGCCETGLASGLSGTLCPRTRPSSSLRTGGRPGGTSSRMTFAYSVHNSVSNAVYCVGRAASKASSFVCDTASLAVADEELAVLFGFMSDDAGELAPDTTSTCVVDMCGNIG